LLLFLFLDFPSPCFFTCPPYNYHQDDDVITFVIDVADIALDTVSLGFKKNKVNIIVFIAFQAQGANELGGVIESAEQSDNRHVFFVLVRSVWISFSD